LALQGAVAPHREKLASLGVEPVLVRTPDELETVEGLIMPGGESTTFLNLMGYYRLTQPLLDVAARRPCWGVCAGSILMAETVTNPPQQSLALLPITVQRNAYGRQNESFITELEMRLPGQKPQHQEAVFIRAPVISAAGEGVQVLAEHDGHPVSVQYRQHLATTFHPELSKATILHRHFDVHLS